jgi:very-short-patch-repair endonuclease
MIAKFPFSEGVACEASFDRQKIIGNYIVDFFCAEKMVIIEIDGSSHDDKIEYDKQRDDYLSGLNLKVIHLLDSDVKDNMCGVIDFLRNHPELKLTPPKEGNT